MNALDLCLRNSLSPIYPAVKDVHLTDYKVRVLGAKGGTASKVRVLVEWTDHRREWATVGISDNVIDASWNALVDALRLELMRLSEVALGHADVESTPRRNGCAIGGARYAERKQRNTVGDCTKAAAGRTRVRTGRQSSTRTSATA